MPGGIQGYNHLKTGDSTKLIPFADLTDQQLHDCYVYWYRANQ